ncbi:collagen alpha-3(IV) chain isoform X6 [Clupea harengus]|uniref:Collagen alpha-3(IV) chain isoform X6 n=1 Tax=Clupea harengus TaxID=7950 RepID=A0A6P8GS96_CLUHA|nr:collagen alpha-3(IV) chain isoform X6 [Clupea harengus]
MNSYRITIMIFFFFIVPLDHASVTCNILVILMDLDVCIADGRLEKMDAETEQVEEQTDIPAAPAEETPPETKNRPGKHLDRGVKGRGRGCRMGRGWRGGRGMMKAFGPPGRGRGRGHDGLMNGFGPMRRGMGGMRPYPDLRGRGGVRGGPRGMGPPPPPPPPLHLRPYPPMHRRGPPPLPLGPPGFRGCPPPPRGHSSPPGHHRHFHPRGGTVTLSEVV